MWWHILSACIVVWLVKRLLLEKCLLKDLKHRPVFITGCDTGFGKEFAEKLVHHGIPCYAGCFTEVGEKLLKESLKTVPKRDTLLTTLRLDVTNPESLTDARHTIEKNGKDLWAIVCNAAIANLIFPDDFLSVDDYKRLAEVNLWSAIRTCHAFKPLIKQSKGRIIVTSSFGGLISGPYCGPYCVSKHALESYCDTIRQELKSQGVTVHVIEPGFFKTNLTRTENYVSFNNQKWSEATADLKAEYGEDYIDIFNTNINNLFSTCCSDDTWKVVDAYFNAAFSYFPRSRYLVGWDAVLLGKMVSLMPDSLQDQILGVFNNGVIRRDIPVLNDYLQ